MSWRGMLAQVDSVQHSFGHVDHLKALEMCRLYRVNVLLNDRAE